MSDSLKKGEEMDLSELKDFKIYENHEAYLIDELNKLRKENGLQKEVIAELQEQVLHHREKHSFYLKRTEELSKENKNKPQENNTRLQGLIDEVFDLLDELEINIDEGYENESKKIEYRIELRLKIINTLK